jgi:hypothetical protein
MQAIVVERVLEASADDVWEIIRRGDGLERWFPPVSKCRLEGSGSGARRVCVLNGAVLEERLVTIDDSARLFQYAIDVQSLLPMRNLLGSMLVTADVASSSGAAAARCRVLWMLNGDLTDPAAHEVVRASVVQLYLSGIDGLEATARSRGDAGGGL